MGSTLHSVQAEVRVLERPEATESLDLNRQEIAMSQVIEIDPQTDARWDSFVSAHPDGLVYHTAAYLQALFQEYANKPVCLACEDTAGNFLGILPLFHTRGLPFRLGGQLLGRRLSSLPRTPVAGPLSLDVKTTNALLQAAVDRAGREHGTALQIKPPRSLDCEHVDGLVCQTWRKTYVLELPGKPEQLHFGNSRNHSRIKQRVNKALRAGVKIRQAETEAELRAWYRVYLEAMRWHVVPPRPYRFFRALWECLGPNRIRLLLAYMDMDGEKKLLAGSIFLMFGRSVFYAFNGRRREDLSMQPNYAILWHAIRDACKEGFRFFDLGEVTIENSGLAEFKGKWAGSPTWLVRYYYPTPPKTNGLEHHLESMTHRYLNSAWRYLPMNLTMLLGKLVYRFL
jgi:hypothetical protein